LRPKQLKITNGLGQPLPQTVFATGEIGKFKSQPLTSVKLQNQLGEDNMALFDALIDDLASRYGLGGNAAPLVREVELCH